jgi:flagella synthesis protein FlgN
MSTPISFEEDSRLVRSLLELLMREQKSLVMSNVDEIEKLLEFKSKLLQSINEVAKKRYAALKQQHFEPNENGMLAWVMQQASTDLKKKWDDFHQVLIKAKEMNRLNGILITKHFNRNQQMLSQLQNAFKTNETYGKNGQTQSGSHLRSSLTA